jgi:hypothetical protein
MHNILWRSDHASKPFLGDQRHYGMDCCNYLLVSLSRIFCVLDVLTSSSQCLILHPSGQKCSHLVSITQGVKGLHSIGGWRKDRRHAQGCELRLRSSRQTRISSDQHRAFPARLKTWRDADFIMRVQGSVEGGSISNCDVSLGLYLAQ